MILDDPNTIPLPASVTGFVDSIKQAWRDGEPPDAARAFREHPELLLHRSLAVDLAYEEYCLLEEAGRTPDAEQFCQRMPAFGSQVREVIRGHRVFADHPELFSKPETDWPKPNDCFDGFTVVKELGRGAFARVYLATDPATGNRPVALKLSPAPSTEACTLGPITHPHIVAVHWSRRVQGLHVVCMPYVGATTLGDVIERAFRHTTASLSRTSQTILSTIEPLTRSVAHSPPVIQGRESYSDAIAAIASRLAGALAFLHRLGVSHGDLKPSNIILGSGGHPFLIDFNLAAGLDSSLLRRGGTLPYMAPERIRLLLGEPDDGDQAAPTDIYSLGVVLFESLTGRMPIDMADLADPSQFARDLLKNQAKDLPSVASFNPLVPRKLARLVDRCLVSNPLKRITAEDLQRELERYLRRQIRRTRLLIGCCALLGTGLIGWQLTTAADPVRTVPEQPQPVNTSLPPKPTTPEKLFDRGREHLQNGDYAAAMKDLGDAHRMKPDGPNTAYLAYSHSRCGNFGSHRAAEQLYLEAIKKFDYKHAWVHCNRAYCLIQCGSAADFPAAIDETNFAVALDPTLRAARLNRAFAQFRASRNPKTKNFANPTNSLADLDAVMASGPCSAELYYRAAQILTEFAEGQESRLIQAVNYLIEAVKLGRDPAVFATEPGFKKHLAAREDFQQLKALPKGKSAPVINVEFVEPPSR